MCFFLLFFLHVDTYHKLENTIFFVTLWSYFLREEDVRKTAETIFPPPGKYFVGYVFFVLLLFDRAWIAEAIGNSR